MFTRLFWKDAIERSAATMAQALVALLSVDGLDLAQLDREALITGTVIAGVLSVLKAVAALKFTEGNSASLTVDNVEVK